MAKLVPASAVSPSDTGAVPIVSYSASRRAPPPAPRPSNLLEHSSMTFCNMQASEMS